MSYDEAMESKKKQNQQAGVPSQGTQQDVTIQDLEAQVKKLTDIAGRAQADLQNAKMRLQKDAEELQKYAAETLLKRLLPTVDNFQRAFQHLPEDLKTNEWVKGVSAIEQDYIRQLTDMGLRKIEALGTPLDPSRHEVLMQGPGETGKVLEVFEDGYELHGRILRPAKVKVGDGSSENGHKDKGHTS